MPTFLNKELIHPQILFLQEEEYHPFEPLKMIIIKVNMTSILAKFSVPLSDV